MSSSTIQRNVQQYWWGLTKNIITKNGKMLDLNKCALFAQFAPHPHPLKLPASLLFILTMQISIHMPENCWNRCMPTFTEEFIKLLSFQLCVLNFNISLTFLFSRNQPSPVLVSVSPCPPLSYPIGVVAYGAGGGQPPTFPDSPKCLKIWVSKQKFGQGWHKVIRFIYLSMEINL